MAEPTIATGFAEVFLESAPGLAELERTLRGIRLFGHLSGIGQGEFADPHLEQEGGDVEGSALLDVEFGGVLDGLHDGQRATGWDWVNDHMNFLIFGLNSGS